ncbi:MAG: response regulator, partial [Thiotrichales bacterium]|nr:response regulator [Thiotrichales bacterium]
MKMDKISVDRASEETLEVNPHVLVIDDDESVFQMYNQVLSRDFEEVEGLDEIISLVGIDDEEADQEHSTESKIQFMVDFADNGEEGYKKVEQATRTDTPYGVILLDMRMPNGWDGLVTAEQIRLIDQEVRIVFITAYMDYSIPEIRQRVGMNFEFLSKPVKSDHLYQMVLSQAFSWTQFDRFIEDDTVSQQLSSELVQTREELIQAKEDVERASQVKDEFLASMSHELRTPLTLIIGNSQILRSRLEEKDNLELIDAIEVSGRSQLALVNDILDLSKIDSGNFTIEETPYDLTVLIKEIQKTFSSQVKNLGLDFMVENCVQAEKMLIGDVQRIGQILINLIGNALKFTSKGSVRLTIEQKGELLSFHLKDTGIGMSTDVTKKLFQRFKQADGSISRRYGGSGLGLFISQNLAALMKGRIDAISEEGKGSTFELTLPYQQSDIAIRKQSSNQDKVVLDQKFLGHVLVAEDTPLLQQLERRILESLEVTVT